MSADIIIHKCSKLGKGVIIRTYIPKRLEWLESGAEFKKKKLTGVKGRLCMLGEMGFSRMKFHFSSTAGIFPGLGSGD